MIVNSPELIAKSEQLLRERPGIIQEAGAWFKANSVSVQVTPGVDPFVILVCIYLDLSSRQKMMTTHAIN